MFFMSVWVQGTKAKEELKKTSRIIAVTRHVTGEKLCDEF